MFRSIRVNLFLWRRNILSTLHNFKWKYSLDDSEWRIHSMRMKNHSNSNDSAVALLFEWNFARRNFEGTFANFHHFMRISSVLSHPPPSEEYAPARELCAQASEWMNMNICWSKNARNVMVYVLSRLSWFIVIYSSHRNTQRLCCSKQEHSLFLQL